VHRSGTGIDGDGAVRSHRFGKGLLEALNTGSGRKPAGAEDGNDFINLRLTDLRPEKRHVHSYTLHPLEDQ
jgi:hypothetical protein